MTEHVTTRGRVGKRTVAERAALSFAGEQARRLDNDRFLAALFAPHERRESLFALYAFGAEIAQIPEKVSEPMLGFIRLQWWREALEGIYAGSPPGHEVARALSDAVSRHGLTRGRFERLLEAREADLDEQPPHDLDALVAYAEGTQGTLTGLAIEALGAAGNDGGSGAGNGGPGECARAEAALAAGREVGVAWALAGVLRAARFHASHRRLHLPADLLAAAGVDPEEVFARRGSPGLARVAEEVAERAGLSLARARGLRKRVPRAALPALLPAALTDAYLKRLRHARYDLFAPELAPAKPRRQLRLLRAGLTGRY